MKNSVGTIIRLLGSVKNYTFLSSIFLSTLTFVDAQAKETVPIAIIGGQSTAPYAAFIDSEGQIIPIEGLPATGLTFRVDMNESRRSIIGGTDDVNAYAAFVSPKGELTPLSGLIAPGEIYSVAINKFGQGMIAGGHQTTNVPYGALVAPNGTVIPLALPATGLMYSVALENSGRGIIGGVGPANSAYAALVTPTGTLIPLNGLPTTGGIFWVAANDNGLKFIGGQDNTSVYAAYVSSNAAVTSIAGLPSGNVYSVDLNNPGFAIIGGTSNTLPYAALVSPTGLATQIDGLPTTAGIIYNVKNNDSGTGLIAGFSTTGAYGAFVAPDGSLTPLIGLPAGTGFLDGAALDPTGVGIVGGTSLNVPFVALAAPNGQLTYLTGPLPASGEINSIATSLLDGLVPKHLGFFDSIANAQFAFSNTLTQHSLLDVRDPGCMQTSCGCDDVYSVWASLFGNYVEQENRGRSPKFTNTILGGVLGLDYKNIQDFVLGAAVAYAYNDVHLFNDEGKANINQESLALYATWYQPYFRVNFAVWGGAFQTTSSRRSLSLITSKASPNGWNVSPHFEVDAPFFINPCTQVVAEPFVAFDWVNCWQTNYKERGDSGFNIILKDRYDSLVRSELGIRFRENFCYNWGTLLVEEKGSYVNRTPLQKNRGSASFIGSISSFEVETCHRFGQNHGVVELHAEAIPACFSDMYFSFDYQGEFGSSFQSQQLTLSLAKDF